MCACWRGGSVRWRSIARYKYAGGGCKRFGRLACTSAQTPGRVNLTTGHIKSNFTFDADLTGEK